MGVVGMVNVELRVDVCLGEGESVGMDEGLDEGSGVMEPAVVCAVCACSMPRVCRVSSTNDMQQSFVLAGLAVLLLAGTDWATILLLLLFEVGVVDACVLGMQMPVVPRPFGFGMPVALLGIPLPPVNCFFILNRSSPVP